MSSIAADSPDLNALLRENSELKTTNLYLQALVEKLQYQIAQLTRRQFGVSSEHAAQIGLFPPAELPSSNAPPPIATTAVPAHERAKPVRRPCPMTCRARW